MKKSDTKSKRPLGITILIIWFVAAGVLHFYNNSMNGVFGSQDFIHLFSGSFTENSLAAYGFGSAMFGFFIAWCFMERKYWIRVPTIIVLISMAGITGVFTLLGHVSILEIIVTLSVTAIIVIYLMKSNVKEYFAQIPSSSTPV